MRRLVVVLSGLLVLPAFAEVAPIYYEESIEYSDEGSMPFATEQEVTETQSEVQVVNPVQVLSPRALAGSGRVSRAIPSGQAGVTTRASSGRGVASRATIARTTTMTPAASRAANSRASRASIIGSAASNKSVSARATAKNAKPSVAARSSIIQTDTVYQPLYSGRVGVSTRSSAVRSRAPVATSISAGDITSSAVAAGISADEMAQLTDFCKAQYAECMDNYCNVLDENQGRCSCSKNLKNYEKTEQALKAATQSLQDVAQQIQYIGLTGDQIETLFTQTEAEAAMQSTSDNTQLKNLITEIGDSIYEIKPGTSSTSSGGLTFDITGLLDGINFGGGIIDFSDLFSGQSTTSINNQRGETLYKTAHSRCKASVLNNCANQGVDISIVTNFYDLEIDKQCIAYERSLQDANENMLNTVRNAKTVLQRARLMVDMSKNEYDLLGCVTELDACMQDEFVCGEDYSECLDPTGKYIVNGAVVKGSTPGTSGSSELNGLFATWEYQVSGDGETAASISPWSENGNLAAYIEYYHGDTASTSKDKIAVYLQDKIGYIEDGKAYGMCSGVLNKCQQYTYDKNGRYEAKNEVVKKYLDRALFKIKAGQDEVLADYAEDCIQQEVAPCLVTNGAATNQSVAVAACESAIKTCASVSGTLKQQVINSALKSSASGKWVNITYDISNCATGWKDGSEPQPVQAINANMTLPEASAINMIAGKTYDGWQYINEQGKKSRVSGAVQVYDTLTFTLLCK